MVVAPLHVAFLRAARRASRLEEPDGASPGATYPAGFLAGGVVAGLKDSGRPDMGVLAVAPEWRAKARLGRRLHHQRVRRGACGAESDEMRSGASGRGGHEQRQRERLHRGAGAAGSAGDAEGVRGDARLCRRPRWPSASTGIIGVQLDPCVSWRPAHARLRRRRQADGGPDFDRSIMTTDRFPEDVRRLEVDTSRGVVRLGVVCQGRRHDRSGHGDHALRGDDRRGADRAADADLAASAVRQSFNRVTVDGEMSTNDSVLFLASGASGVARPAAALRLLGAALEAMLLRVALMMVADGEGATKIMRLRVDGRGGRSAGPDGWRGPSPTRRW